MITVATAEQIIQTHWLTPQYEFVPIGQCEGRVLAEPIYADRDYPPMDRVMMDGIAISKKSYDQGLREFKIAGMATAGTTPLHLENPEMCIEVMTGCPLPKGTDFIIPYEQLDIQQGVAKIITEINPQVNNSVHHQGSDCSSGSLVIPPGTKLKGIHLGILASFGYTEVLVESSLKIKVIATGDELIPVNKKPQSYQLRQSNIYALRASLVSYGYSEVDIDYIPDRPELIISHYQENSSFYDLLIYSGGVSKGKRDYLPQVWQSLGVEQYIHGVKQKPGKPMWFGIDNSTNTMILGLPGNPVSGLICLHRYLLNCTTFWGYLQEMITFPPDLTYFVPVKVNHKLEFEPVLPKNSGDFIALTGTDGFIELPPEYQFFPIGESYRFYPWY